MGTTRLLAITFLGTAIAYSERGALIEFFTILLLLTALDVTALFSAERRNHRKLWIISRLFCLASLCVGILALKNFATGWMGGGAAILICVIFIFPATLFYTGQTIFETYRNQK